MKSFRNVVFVLLLLRVLVHGRHIVNLHSHYLHREQSTKEESAAKPDLYQVKKWHRRGDPQQIAGSSLPDCTHACGSCMPCRLVMVSFVCSSLEEAETCPMAYKCMCNNKSYPVP
ncbi:protein EPIDERMAL PATTERNING FACTOR 1-like [Primulina tabacum]|uniref:protein EPIDERMAL PATTERNING FACTOR 1-like n=1 Tax=Primulina tabacum TaxID=48773 RepID=UPI003F5A8139